MSEGRHVALLLALGMVLAPWVPLSVVAEETTVDSTPEVVTESEETIEEIEVGIETEEEIPPDLEEVSLEIIEVEEESLLDLETVPPEETIADAPKEEAKEEELKVVELPEEPEFFAPLNLLAGPEEVEEPEAEGEIIYDFPTYLWGSSNGAFASGSGIGPHSPGAYSFEDLDGAWDSVVGDFTRWNDPDTSYTFNRLDLFLAVQDLPGLGPLDSHPLTAGMVQVKIYAANESWQKGALVATSLPVDATTLFLQKADTICHGLGANGAPFSDECVVEFTFDIITLEAGQHYLFEVTAEEVVSAAPFSRDRYYYPSLLVVGAGVTKDPWYGADGVQDAPRFNTGAVYMRLRLTEPENTGVSSILFLPGFLGSRLYTDGDRKLWESNGSDDFSDLALNPDGSSHLPVYVGDVVDVIRPDGGPELGTVYGELMGWIANLAADEQIAGWAAYPYDWRYDVFDVIDDGALKKDGSRQYLTQLVEDMAEESWSGKVTIIGHSNGGLLAKALMVRLQEEGKADLVDRVIMIGTPQIGTPKGMLSLLHGHDIARPFWTPQGTVRASAITMPGAYSLLPSEEYFTQVPSPLALFDEGGVTQSYRDVFGETVATALEAFSFMRNDPETRAIPEQNDIGVPYPLPPTLLNVASNTHMLLDTWTPPPGVIVNAIAGWGNKTIIGAHYYERTQFSCSGGIFSCGFNDYEPLTVGDGDDTVVAPSALFRGDGIYFDLVTLGGLKDEKENRTHKDLTESVKIHDYISFLLGLRDIFDTRLFVNEEPEGTGNDIVVSVHSPVLLSLTDEDGNKTGIFPYPDSDLYYIQEEIPGSSIQFGGEGKYVFVPKEGKYNVSINGMGTGTFTVEVEEDQEEGAFLAIANVPVTLDTEANMTIDQGTEGVSDLSLDKEGDREVDTTIAFRPNETVIYQEESSDTEEEESSGGGRGGRQTAKSEAVQEDAPQQQTLDSERNPYLLPYTPFIGSYDAPAPTKEEYESPKSSNVQTASAYNAFGAAFDWLSGIWQVIWSWILKVF